MAEVGGNIKELEGIVQAKTNNVRVIEQGTSYNPLLPPCRISMELIQCHQNSAETENGI